MKVLGVLALLLLANQAHADFASDLIGLGMSAELADKLGNRFEASTTSTGVIKFNFGGSSRYQFAYDSSSPNFETYANTADGVDNQYIYMSGGGGPTDIAGGRGAVLELAGNEVNPSTSRGRAQLFSGNASGGHIGFNVTNGTDGKVIVQSASTTTFHYQPSDATAVIYGNTSLGADTGTRTLSLLAGIYLDSGAAKLEVPNGATIPATCTIGEVFQDTNSDDCADTGAGDGALCLCKASNTWALVANI